MAHLSEIKDKSDVSKVKEACRNDGFFVKTDLFVELGSNDRLRLLFDQVLFYFLKRVSVDKDVIWVFPPKLSDGVEVDLFTLFWVVRKMGNFELVSKNDLWEFVAMECGLDVTHVESLKEMYVKYLKGLDQWLTLEGLKDNGDLGVVEKLHFEKLHSLSHELNGDRCSLSHVGFESDKKGKCVVMEASDKGCVENDIVKCVVMEASDKGCVENDIVSCQTRRNEESLSLSRMLDWVANAARNPHDVAIGTIPSSSKWPKCKKNEVWKQVLLVKETLFAKRNVDSGNNVYGSQKKRRIMHPSMYEDDKIPVRSSKRMRCSQRVSPAKSCSCPGCRSCSSSPTKRVKKTPQILTVEIQDDTREDQEPESVNGGAEVPEWTGCISESDPKWLGTRMWPPPHNENRKHEEGVIGKGRQNSCACLVPGSADCVRLHIAENRMTLKRTLDQLFYTWKFHHMGEDAAHCSWSLNEESEFKSLVIKARQELTDRSKSRHEIMSNFWKRASESIPSKTKAVIVSYYFNVFVLRRRSYQNRVMPQNIDSDDDEQEVGYEKIEALSVNAPRLHTA